MVRRVGCMLAALFACLGIGAAAGSDRYPDRPVRLIVPFVAGGTVDVIARIVGKELAETWKQPVVVENRLGAGGNIATELVAKAPPDGYTLLLTTAAIVIAPSVYKGLSFDPIADFIPVRKLGISPALLLVNPRLQVDSVSALVALARSRPGKLNYGSSGTGASIHLATELFRSIAGIDIVHVPYKGSPPAFVDLASGDLDFMFESLRGALPLAKSGKVKALAVTTAQRSPLAPEFPTVSESGVPGYDFSFWYGILAPTGTPAPIVDKIARDLDRILATATMKEQLAAQGVTVVESALDRFTEENKAELAQWAEVAKRAGLKPQ